MGVTGGIVLIDLMSVYCLQDGDDIYIFCSIIGNNCFPVFKTHEHFDNLLPNVTATQNYGVVNT